MLAGIDGVGDIALTTNGALLAGKAWVLPAAGLRRVTVSLDSLDDAVFMALNDAAFPVAGVLDAIAAAAGAGLPVKVTPSCAREPHTAQARDVTSGYPAPHQQPCTSTDPVTPAWQAAAMCRGSAGADTHQKLRGKTGQQMAGAEPQPAGWQW
jgi:hypothetical protein